MLQKNYNLTQAFNSNASNFETRLQIIYVRAKSLKFFREHF
jgi:hypothetical protein